MTDSLLNPALVTIVVVPRERFSVTQASLESIYHNTGMPFELVYVDGGSPSYVRHYLQAMAAEKGFHLHRSECFLSPNQARNIGVQHARGRYVVFIDNDVIVMPGWLKALTGCAEETGASVVAPLYFFGKPENRMIHMAGGDLRIEARGDGLFMSEQHRHANRHLAEIEGRLRREKCGFAEFHCMLVRRQVLDDTGPLDEKMLSVSEHVDFCHSVELAGGSTWLEPDARVSYLADAPFRLSDIPFFTLRWSEDWNNRSISHFKKKWNLVAESTLFNEDFLDWTRRKQQQLKLPGGSRHRSTAQDAASTTAQTNIQLYRQCMALGYEEHELILLRDGYRLAQAWFDGLYRGCGKSFLAHLVGTASILARHGASASLVVAGMLHSAYEFGKPGIDEQGTTEKKRISVARRTGVEIESLLYHYATFDWEETNIAAIETNLERMPLRIAQVLLMRMANELEERHDMSIAFFAKKLPGSNALEPWLALFRKVAERTGTSGLHAELTDALRNTMEFSAPDSLCNRNTGTYYLQGLKEIAVKPCQVTPPAVTAANKPG